MPSRPILRMSASSQTRSGAALTSGPAVRRLVRGLVLVLSDVIEEGIAPGAPAKRDTFAASTLRGIAATATATGVKLLV